MWRVPLIYSGILDNFHAFLLEIKVAEQLYLLLLNESVFKVMASLAVMASRDILLMEFINCDLKRKHRITRKVAISPANGLDVSSAR